MTTIARQLIAAALVLGSAPALAHELACEGEVAAVRTDASGAPILGGDGLPILEPELGGASIWHYPATIGLRVHVRNTAPDTSVVREAWSSLQGLSAVTWFGDAFSAGKAFPAGAAGDAVAVARIADQGACLALRGPAPACGEALQSRFVLTHDAGSAECRIWLRCGPEREPPPGPSWAPVPSGTSADLTGVWGSAADDVWAVGAGGAILHWDGRAWSPVESGTAEDLTAVWGTSADDVWATGHHLVLHWDGLAWSKRMNSVVTLRGVWGSRPDDVWISSEIPMFHWDGGHWGVVELAEAPEGFFGMWGASADDIWAGGVGTLAHWPATGGWEVVPRGSPAPVYAVWGWAPGSFFTGGPSIIDRYEGGAWVSGQHFMNSIFYGLWGSSAEDVWAVGVTPMGMVPSLFHWDGVAWHSADAPGAGPLAAVWGAAADDVWAVGGGGVILRYATR